MIVEFKRFDDGEVIVLFPYAKWDDSGLIMSYMRVGQHGGADKELLNELDDALPQEYEELKAELKFIGYILDEVAA